MAYAQPILATLAAHRALTVEQLLALVPLAYSRPTLVRELKDAIADGVAETIAIPGSRTTVYCATAKTLRRYPELAARFPGSPKPTVDTIIAAWQCAQAWIAARNAGYDVGRDLPALLALRRHLIAPADPAVRSVLEDAPPLREPRHDGALIVALYRCPRCSSIAPSAEHPRTGAACGSTMRRSEPAMFDIAWNDEDAFVILADNPYRSIRSQLEALPVRTSAYDQTRGRHIYQPKLAVQFLPSDDGSVWSVHGAWAMRGPRLRQFEALTSRQPRNAAHFPFSKTVSVLNPSSAVVFHEVRESAHGAS